MNLETADLQELKAAAYEQLIAREQANANLAAIEAELTRRNQEVVAADNAARDEDREPAADNEAAAS